jgi:hypothetical protein
MQEEYPYIRLAMHQLNRVFFALMMVTCCGCAHDSTKGEFNLDALTGKWVVESDHTLQFEQWRKADSETYSGMGYVMEGGDTTFFESLEILKVDGVWTYFAKVIGSNHDEAIPFALSKQSNERIEFRNENHDFPQKIGYEMVSENELQAYIEGPRDGQTIRILFNYRRDQ